MIDAAIRQLTLRLEGLLLYALPAFIFSFFFIMSTSGLRNFFYLFVLLPSVFLFLQSRQQFALNELLVRCALALAIYCSLSTFWNPAQSTSGALVQSKELLFTLAFFLAVVNVGSRVSQVEIERAMIFFCISAGLYSVLIMAAYFTGTRAGIGYQLLPIFQDIGLRGHIAEWNKYSTFQRLAFGANVLDNPINTATILGLALICAAHLMFGKQTRQRHVVVFICMIPSFIVFLLAQSRAPTIALVVAVVLLLLCYRAKFQRVYFAVAFFCIVAFGFAYFTSVMDKLLDRAFQFGPKLGVYEKCISEGLETPFFGMGYLNLVPVKADGFTAAHCHNMYLDVFRFGGLIGLVLALWVFAYAAYCSFNSRVPSIMFWGIVLVFGFICLNSDGSFPVSKPSVNWLIYWLPLAMIVARRRFRDSVDRRESTIEN